MVSQHDEYYFEDGNVIFQVGNRLFRVHKRLLVGSESSAFASMFSLPQSWDAEGQTDEKPIILSDSPKEFESLMRILYPSLLDHVFDIPIATYAQAMRIAVKYSMDDILNAVITVISFDSFRTGSKEVRAIARLASMAEFPNHFSRDTVVRAFIDACSIKFHPTAHDLEPLMAHPAFVALMMQYREGLGNSERAIWERNAHWSARDGQPIFMGPQTWVNEQFRSLGFNEEGLMS